MPLCRRSPFRNPALVLAASLMGLGGSSGVGAALAGSQPAADPGCRPSAAGRWVVMEQGSDGAGPVARLRQERWHADGRVEGVLLERRDKAWRERAYVGQVRAAGACRVTSLAGVVLSQQQGLSWQNGGWRPNAVVQRELWRSGQVEGVALMSVAGRQEVAPYTGEITLAPSCLATIRQKDALGVLYNYRAVVLADGSGYLYLQTDPADLTVGWLEHR